MKQNKRHQNDSFLTTAHFSRELVRTIVNELRDDKQTLLECSLVSRTWRAETIPFLFRELTVRRVENAYYFGGTRTPMRYERKRKRELAVPTRGVACNNADDREPPDFVHLLLRFLDNSPHIAKHSRTLSLPPIPIPRALPHQDNKFGMAFILREILARLPHLETLSIDRIEQDQKGLPKFLELCPTHGHRYYPPLKRQTRLSELNLCMYASPIGLLVPILALFSDVKVFKLAMYFSASKLTTMEIIAPKICPPSLRLESLLILNHFSGHSSKHLLAPFEAVLQPSSLKHLSLCDISIHSVPSMNQFLAQFGTGLESLSYSGTYFHKLLDVTLSPCRYLRRLHLAWEVSPMAYDEEQIRSAWNACFNMLASNTSRSLTKLRLTLWMCHHPGAKEVSYRSPLVHQELKRLLAAFDWRALERAVRARSGVLRCVWLEVCNAVKYPSLWGEELEDVRELLEGLVGRETARVLIVNPSEAEQPVWENI